MASKKEEFENQIKIIKANIVESRKEKKLPQEVVNIIDKIEDQLELITKDTKKYSKYSFPKKILFGSKRILVNLKNLVVNIFAKKKTPIKPYIKFKAVGTIEKNIKESLQESHKVIEAIQATKINNDTLLNILISKDKKDDATIAPSV